MTATWRHSIAAVALVALSFQIFPSRAGAQGAPPGAGRTVSLQEALGLAAAQSEAVGIARAAVTRAGGDQITARSQLFPQIFASAGYTKTLKSQFESFSGGGDPDTETPASPPGPCGQYLQGVEATIEQRLAGVETATRCSLGNSILDGLGNLPFGQENQWSLGLQLSQNLYSGGRVTASTDLATTGRRIAEIELTTQLAQLQVDVTEAYYDAVLADRLVNIADSSLAQTEEALRQTDVGRQVGDRSEFDLLRARVTRDNQRPVLIQRRTQRDLAYYRLKQLIGMPLDAPVQLTTGIQDEQITIIGLPAGADTTAASRATVRQADEAIAASEALLRIQRAERYPAISLTSQYGRVAYPSSVVPSWNDFLDNWTVGVALQLPVFTGGRLRGTEIAGRADVDEARLRARQVTELAALDARATVASLTEAEEAWRASLGTVEQAQRANEIALVRFREGLSTQLELTEARVLLQQAQANRAVAARNLQVLLVRLSLIRDLPLGTGSGATGSSTRQIPNAVQQPPQQPAGTGGGIGGISTGGPGGID